MSEVNTPFPKLKLTVTGVFGECYHGYKIGDEITLEDFTHPPKHFCLGLAHALFPVIYALSFGAKFPFMEQGEDGWWRLPPHQHGTIPFLFSLQARKPA